MPVDLIGNLYVAGQVFIESDECFKFDHKLVDHLDRWEKEQRKALDRAERSLKTKASVWSVISYVVFIVGWMLTIADKATGKPPSELKTD